MRRTSTSAVLLTLLTIGTSGCGFIFVNGPPENHQKMEYFNCTESEVGPILDGIWAGLNAAGATTAAINPDEYENSGAIITSGLIWTGVSGAASIVGQNKVNDCRNAKRALAERQGGNVRPDTTNGQ